MTKKIIAVDLDEPRSTQTVKFLTLPKNHQKLRKKAIRLLLRQVALTVCQRFFYRGLGLDTPMINFNGSLTHLPDQVWDFEKCLTVDKKYLLDMVQRSEDIQADFIAGEYRKNSTLQIPMKKLPIPNYL